MSATEAPVLPASRDPEQPASPWHLPDDLSGWRAMTADTEALRHLATLTRVYFFLQALCCVALLLRLLLALRFHRPAALPLRMAVAAAAPLSHVVAVLVFTMGALASLAVVWLGDGDAPFASLADALPAVLSLCVSHSGVFYRPHRLASLQPPGARHLGAGDLALRWVMAAAATVLGLLLRHLVVAVMLASLRRMRSADATVFGGGDGRGGSNGAPEESRPLLRDVLRIPAWVMGAPLRSKLLPVLLDACAHDLSERNSEAAGDARRRPPPPRLHAASAAGRRAAARRFHWMVRGMQQMRRLSAGRGRRGDDCGDGSTTAAAAALVDAALAAPPPPSSASRALRAALGLGAASAVTVVRRMRFAADTACARAPVLRRTRVACSAAAARVCALLVREVDPSEMGLSRPLGPVARWVRDEQLWDDDVREEQPWWDQEEQAGDEGAGTSTAAMMEVDSAALLRALGAVPAAEAVPGHRAAVERRLREASGELRVVAAAAAATATTARRRRPAFRRAMAAAAATTVELGKSQRTVELRRRYVEAVLAAKLAVREGLARATHSGAIQATMADLRVDPGRLRMLTAYAGQTPVVRTAAPPPRPRFLDDDDDDEEQAVVAAVVPQWTPPPLPAPAFVYNLGGGSGAPVYTAEAGERQSYV